MVVLEDKASVKAVAEKDMGNSYYKKKEFQKALESYDRAIDIDPTNISFYTNKAAVFFEQGEYEKCRETCQKAIDIGKTYDSDPKLIARAYGRIGSSLMKEKKYDEASGFFAKSLRECQTDDVREKLDTCEKEIKEQEKFAYINPEISRKEKGKGDEAFREGNLEDSIVHYTEAIKRNPDEAKLYLNRAAAHMKLLKYNEALCDCEESILKDSTFTKGYICKGAALESMQRFDEALDSYSKALDLNPNAEEASSALYRCVARDYRRKNNPDCIYRRATENAIIKEILSKQEIKHLLDDVNRNPNNIHKYLSNPSMASDINTLVHYGLIKLT